MEVLARAKTEKRHDDLRRLRFSCQWIPCDPLADFEGAACLSRACRKLWATGMADSRIGVAKWAGAPAGLVGLSLGYTERQQPTVRLLQETLDKGPVLAATAVREAPPEPLSPESTDLFTAPSRLHSAQVSLHRANIALQDFMGSLDRPNFRRADEGLAGASPGSSARLRHFLDLAVNTADEQDLGVVLQRIVDRAADASGACVALEVYGHDGLSVTATFLNGAGVAEYGSCWHPDAQRRLDDVIVGETPIVVPGGRPLRANSWVPIERAGRVYGQLAIFQNQSGTSFSDADDQALMRMLASFAACAIESAERVASERNCDDAEAARTADQLRQHSGEELRAAVTAAQDEERAEVSRRLSSEVDRALDSVLGGLHRIGGPHDSSVEISATGDQIDELRGLIADAQCKTRRMAVELRIVVVDVS